MRKLEPRKELQIAHDGRKEGISEEEKEGRKQRRKKDKYGRQKGKH